MPRPRSGAFPALKLAAAVVLLWTGPGPIATAPAHAASAAPAHGLSGAVRVSKVGRDLYQLSYSGPASDDPRRAETLMALEAARLALDKGARALTLVPSGPASTSIDGYDPTRRYSFRMAMWRVDWIARPDPATSPARARALKARATVRLSPAPYDGVDPLGFDPWALRDYLEPQLTP